MREREIIVVGGGPAGLSAALAASQAGAQVTVLDGYARPGGQYYHLPPPRLLGDVQSATHRQRDGLALWRAAEGAGVEIRSNTAVWNVTGERVVAAAAGSGTDLYQAQAVILATGAYERTTAFPGWTLPGVITAGAAQSLLYQGVLPGRRVLLAGTGPLQLVTAAQLLKAGVEVVTVLEGARPVTRGLGRFWAAWGQWERLAEGAECLLALLRAGVPYRMGWGILAAHGQESVQGASIARLDRDWRPIPGAEQRVECDTICVGFGFVPLNALSCLAGAQQTWDTALGGEIPTRDEHMQTSVPGIYVAGDGAGIGGYRLSMIEGRIAGLSAAGRLGYGAKAAGAAVSTLLSKRRREAAFQRLYAALFTPGPGIYELAGEDTLICRCEGVTFGRLRQAVAERGARSLSEVKNLTRCGMGECQGRVCGSQVNYWAARWAGLPLEHIGFNQPRPPLFPLPLDQLVPKD